MKLSELKKFVDRQFEFMRSDEDPEVVVQITLPYSTVGGSPFVKVKTVQMGFDWDHGKFFLYPEENLTPSDRDFAKQMREMQERAGWADYENRNLKAEIRKLESASGGFVGRPGDKVKVNVEVVRSVYSQQYGVYFVSGVTTDDQAVFFSYKWAIQPGKLIIAEGTVKAHRDNSTQLNRVKVI